MSGGHPVAARTHLEAARDATDGGDAHTESVVDLAVGQTRQQRWNDLPPVRQRL